MTADEGIEELRRFRNIVSAYGQGAIDAVLAEVERLTRCVEEDNRQFAAIARGQTRGYGITAGELHNCVIAAMVQHCEHIGLPTPWLDGEAGRPLDQTICMAITAATAAGG
ncbi:MAG: hypothetical protein PHU85_01935 [Phycisphaerae bacterium]|nr:hypothetical protein [Phycisphaerae bacterium]